MPLLKLVVSEDLALPIDAVTAPPALLRRPRKGGSDMAVAAAISPHALALVRLHIDRYAARPDDDLAGLCRDLVYRTGATTMQGVAEALGCEVKDDTLRAAEGGLSGLCIPISKPPPRFRIVVDGSGKDTRDFIIGHEVGHVLLGLGDGRRRPRLSEAAKAQERHCDAIAVALAEALDQPTKDT